MSSIEVTCECGRVYVLPADKEGRKLQCRRCGAVIAIRRDADPGVVVPFRSVSSDDESDERTKGAKEGRPAKKPEAGQGRLDLVPLPAPKTSLRRCPGCGFRDDPAIVICVRCGFDFRDGTRPPPATRSAARVKADQTLLEREADERITRVEQLAKISFVPIVGLLFGLAALVLASLGAGSLRDLSASARKALESRLAAAKLMAVATCLIWAGSLGFYFLVYRPQQRHEIHEGLAQACRGHLESLGRWMREARGDDDRFPRDTKETLADGLRDLAEAHGQGDAVLTCPLLGGEPYTIDGGLAAIETKTNGEYLVAWDSAPHPEGDGSLRWFALRADGGVEELRSAAQLEKARARPSERFSSSEAAAPDTTGRAAGRATGRAGGREPSAGRGGDGVSGDRPGGAAGSLAGFDAHRRELMKLGAELDAADPGLTKTLTTANFRARIGLPPWEAAAEVVAHGDDDLRHVAARVIARLDVPGPEMLRLTNQLDGDADPETRWTLVLALKRAGAPAWLDACGALASEALPPISEQALALLAGEARSGREGLKRVLLCARDRRRLSKIGSDQPIFALPPDIYPTLAQEIEEPDVGAEALAVLARGGAEVDGALEPLFSRPEPHVRELAFRALRSSLAWRDAPRATLHAHLKAETSREVRAAVLQLMVDSVDGETVKRALEGLRDGGADALAAVARKILSLAKDPGALSELVRELDRPGSARDAVVAELRRVPRILDEAVSDVIAQKAPFLEAAGQETAIALAADRYDDAAHKFLLREALSGANGAVREAAWKAIVDGARLSDGVRAQVQEVLPARLLKETDPAPRSRIIELLGRYEFRSNAGLTALEQFARRTAEPSELRERAIASIALSNDPRAVSVLIDLVDMLTGHPKFVVTAQLRDLVGVGGQPSTAAEWRRLVHPVDGDLKRKLKERDARERTGFRDRQDRIEEHLRELRERGS